MNAYRSILVLFFWMGISATLLAQPFFGYQTIGVHTYYFSLSWDGTQPYVGLGYLGRLPQSGFTDIGAEWRMPLAAPFDWDQQELIVGAYGPVALRRRPFMGGGVHARIGNSLVDGQRTTRVTLATTMLPSYTYLASINDRPYATAGLRLTYLLVILEKGAQAEALQWLPAFGTELGGHLDLHIQRTLGLATNGFASRYWALGSTELSAAEQKWTIKGDLYFGSTYRLRR